MTPLNAYINLRPWARRLVDRRLGWLLPLIYVAWVPVVLAAQLVRWCYETAAHACEIVCHDLPRQFADDWRSMRAASQYRRPTDTDGGAA